MIAVDEGKKCAKRGVGCITPTWYIQANLALSLIVRIIRENGPTNENHRLNESGQLDIPQKRSREKAEQKLQATYFFSLRHLVPKIVRRSQRRTEKRRSASKRQRISFSTI